MAEDSWRRDDVSDELADAAKLFDEFDDPNQNHDSNDILYVEGLEDDEPVEDEDIPVEMETVTSQTVLTTQLEKNEGKKEKTIAELFSIPSTETNEQEMTIGEFFLPLIRQSPPSKIHSENDTIGSLFEKYTNRDGK